MRSPRRTLIAATLSLAAVTVRADAPRSAEKLGTIHFDAAGDALTCEHVVRGVKLLHHMMYVEADREFAAAVAHDPACVLGYWGRAMAIVHPLWPDVPDAMDIRRGLEFVDAGVLHAAMSGRELAYLRTMDAFFRLPAGTSLPRRLQATDQAWADVVQSYPADLDAAAFGALYHLAPARFLPRDKSHRLQLEAAATLEKIAREIPDHPGALHYRIHAYDFPLLAGRALAVCSDYGEIAPEVPHALHMPTHIFTRQGDWDQSIDFNERSAAAARAMVRADHALNSHLPHALDYLAYAYLQRGEYQKAELIAAELRAASGPYQPVNRPAMAYAFAAVPARLALERHDWITASRLELWQPASFPWGDSYLYCDSMVRFARAVGAARLGHRDAAQAEIAQLEKLREQIVAVIPGSYWAAQSNVQIATARAWVAFSEGRGNDAVTFLREAASQESSTDKEAVTPGEVIPAGESLGELLLELGRPREAVEAFAAQSQVSPRRFNGVYGTARAAEMAGQPALARRYYAEFAALGAHADAGNPRLAQAQAYLQATQH